MADKTTYLGDGVYASNDGFGILIETERPENGRNWIVFEPEVFNELLQFAIRIGWLEKGQVLHGR